MVRLLLGVFGEVIIDGLLCAGTYLFVGAPKVGKSFLMAQFAYHVSTGCRLWDYAVNKGTVLYLALEDTPKRLQGRLFRMFDTNSTNNLHFTTAGAKQVGSGLDEQLKGFVREHPDTKLIIIDTLQKIRETGGDKFSYANDYELVGKLKRFADSHQLCLLLVHHTRKQQADDKFDMISGTNGLLGAADGAFLLQKEKRTSNSATLDISGRDQQDQRLYLTKDVDRLIKLPPIPEDQSKKYIMCSILQSVQLFKKYLVVVRIDCPCCNGKQLAYYQVCVPTKRIGLRRKNTYNDGNTETIAIST